MCPWYLSQGPPIALNIFTTPFSLTLSKSSSCRNPFFFKNHLGYLTLSWHYTFPKEGDNGSGRIPPPFLLLNHVLLYYKNYYLIITHLGLEGSGLDTGLESAVVKFDSGIHVGLTQRRLGLEGLKHQGEKVREGKKWVIGGENSGNGAVVVYIPFIWYRRMIGSSPAFPLD